MKEIFPCEKNPKRAASLREHADQKQKELNKVQNLVSTETITEFYFDIMKELILARMYELGFHTLSHKLLIEFLQENSKQFSPFELQLIDELRTKRNDVYYYGKKIHPHFILQHKNEFESIIEKLKRECI